MEGSIGVDPGLVGRTFGQYRVISLIQRGGMGEIYLAELAPQKIRVVLKRLQEVHTSDERYVEMFQNEAAVMSELDHPNVVKVLGVPVIEGKQCLVMEFVKGRNLQQVLRRLRNLGRVIPPTMAVLVLRKVLLGLHEAHQARFEDGRPLDLVHRDVKPGNILISFAGDVKITDFGIAKSAMQNRMTTRGVVKGTVRYLSPEQIRSERITFRSDLFSCASVLVEVLTDQPLYDRGQVAPTLMAILNDERAPIEDLLPFRAPELAQVLERALRTKPDERFGSAWELAQALGAAARTLGPPVADDALGALLRQLFQGSAETAEGGTPEDVTYLMANDNPSSGSRPLARSRGSAPLVPAEFAGGGGWGTRAQGSSARREPPPLPQEFIDADARARRMLEPVVFEQPVELAVEQAEALVDRSLPGSHALEEDDLDIDLDALDVCDHLLQPVASGGPRSSAAVLGSVRQSASFSAPSGSTRTSSGASTSSASLFTHGLRAEEVDLDSDLIDVRPRWWRRGPVRDGGAGAGHPLRLYLLLGCLAGVLLTCAVVALGRL